MEHSIFKPNSSFLPTLFPLTCFVMFHLLCSVWAVFIAPCLAKFLRESPASSEQNQLFGPAMAGKYDIKIRTYPWHPGQTEPLSSILRWRRWKTWTSCTNIWSTDSTAFPSTAQRRWWKETLFSCKTPPPPPHTHTLLHKRPRPHSPLGSLTQPCSVSVRQVGTMRRKSPFFTRTSRR